MAKDQTGLKSRDLPEMDMRCVVLRVCRGEMFNFLKTIRLTSIAKINMNNVMQPSVLVSSHSVFKTSIGAWDISVCPCVLLNGLMTSFHLLSVRAFEKMDALLAQPLLTPRLQLGLRDEREQTECDGNRHRSTAVGLRPLFVTKLLFQFELLNFDSQEHVLSVRH